MCCKQVGPFDVRSSSNCLVGPGKSYALKNIQMLGAYVIVCRTCIRQGRLSENHMSHYGLSDCNCVSELVMMTSSSSPIACAHGAQVMNEPQPKASGLPSFLLPKEKERLLMAPLGINDRLLLVFSAHDLLVVVDSTNSHRTKELMCGSWPLCPLSCGSLFARTSSS